MPISEILNNIETIVEKTLQFYDKSGSDEVDLLKYYLLENESLKEEVKVLKEQAVIDAEAVVTAQVKLLDNVHLREIIDNLQRDLKNLSDEKTRIEGNAVQEILLYKKLQKDAEVRYSNMENEYSVAIHERAALLQSIRAIDSAETRMQELTGNLEVLLETKKGLEMRVVELSDQLTQACNEKESLSLKLCNYEKDRTEFNEMESSILVNSQQKRMLEERVRDLEAEIASSKKLKEVMDKKYHEAQNSCLKFQEIETKLEKEIAKLQRDCADTQQYSNQLQRECDRLLTESSSKDGEISELKGQVTLLEDECNTVLKQLMQTRDAIVNESEDGNDSSAEILMLRQSLTIAAEKYDQLKNSMKEILAEKDLQYKELLARVPAEIEKPVALQLDIESADAPVVVIQLGYCSTKLYAYNTTDYILEQVYTCPTIIAQAKRPPSSGGSGELVKNASFQADSMYQFYRENGYFIGNDAEFCLLQHPDGALRGLLHEISILNRDGHLLNTCNGSPITVNHVIQLIQYVLQKGVGVGNLSKVQLVLATKAIYDRNDYLQLAQILYLYLNAERVCLLDECYLSSTLLDLRVKSYVVVDIGSHYTTIAPYYEGFILKNSVKQTSLGGETCTRLYEQMLHRQQIAYYSATTSSKRTSIARFVKEQSIFVVQDFEQSKIEYGEFKHEKIAVLAMSDNNEPNISASETTLDADAATSKARKSITKSISLCIPETATTATIHVDLERFYGGEVLFSPELFCDPGPEAVTSIPALLVAVIESIDPCVREEICSTILITGGSACIPGFKERLVRDIGPQMARLGVNAFNVLVDANSARLDTLSSRIATSQLDKGKIFHSRDYDSLGDEVFCDP